MKIYIHNDKITLEEADKDQSDLVGEMNNFTTKTRPRDDEKKKIVKKNLIFTRQGKWFLMDLKTKYF